jgi:hypothetical protein
MMAAPESVTVTAYASDASVVGETTTAITWTRAGGSDECGGPGVAGPVKLTIAASPEGSPLR